MKAAGSTPPASHRHLPPTGHRDLGLRRPPHRRRPGEPAAARNPHESPRLSGGSSRRLRRLREQPPKNHPPTQRRPSHRACALPSSTATARAVRRGVRTVTQRDMYNDFQRYLENLLFGLSASESEIKILGVLRDIYTGIRELNKKFCSVKTEYARKD